MSHGFVRHIRRNQLARYRLRRGPPGYPRGPLFPGWFGPGALWSPPPRNPDAPPVPRDAYDRAVRQARGRARTRLTPAPARPRRPDQQVYRPHRGGGERHRGAGRGDPERWDGEGSTGTGGYGGS